MRVFWTYYYTVHETTAQQGHEATWPQGQLRQAMHICVNTGTIMPSVALSATVTPHLMKWDHAGHMTGIQTGRHARTHLSHEGLPSAESPRLGKIGGGRSGGTPFGRGVTPTVRGLEA